MSEKIEPKAISSLLQNFLQRHSLSGKLATAAWVIEVAKTCTCDLFGSASAEIDIECLNEQEVIMRARDPYLAQEIRLKSTQLLALINQELAKPVVKRIRVQGS